MTQDLKEKAIQFTRDFCYNTPRIKPESGVVFHDRLLREVTKLLKEERLAVLNRAWEYVVKASREEHGSKEEFIKFVNETV